MSGYLLSYTSTALSPYESEVVATLYLECGDWESVRERVIDENVVQKGTLASRKRLFLELKKRLTTLTGAQLAYYKEASASEAKALTMLSCFKCYRFIYDFATEVMRRKLLLFDYEILNSDYESFYDSKRVAYENLNTVSEATQKKLKQVMFRMFEQAGFIDDAKRRHIQKPYLTEALIQLIVEDDPRLLGAFLYSDREIDEMKKRYG
jgi:hypothetical protein